MIYENAVRLGVYPMAAIVKVGDTLADIHEGLNAGCWSVGVAATGNLVGLSEQEFGALPPAEKQERLRSARAELGGAGAHFVVDSVAELDPVLDEIDLWLKAGETLIWRGCMPVQPPVITSCWSPTTARVAFFAMSTSRPMRLPDLAAVESSYGQH